MVDAQISIPDGVTIGKFAPVAYYDAYMDCIRVYTHDRSVTEHRIDEFFTVYECNNRGAMDPEYVGFTIKGVRHLFEEVGIPLEGVHRLAEIINKLIKYRPGSMMSETLRLIYAEYRGQGDLEVDLADAA